MAGGRSPGHPGISSIPLRFNGAAVYAVSLDNGMVKVGYSKSPRTRMGSLCAFVRRQFGARIVDMHIGQPMPAGEAYQAEARVLARMRLIAAPVAGHLEFFNDTTFAVARDLVDLITATTPQA